MFNPFLIFYWVVLILFLGGFFAVIYHLNAYKFNEKVAFLASSLFVVGTLILLAINIIIAIEINWEEFVIVF